MIKKNSLVILLSLLFFNLSFAKDINIQENINLSFECKLGKKIITYHPIMVTNLDSDLVQRVIQVMGNVV